MHILLFVFAVLSFVLGAFVLLLARSAIHEILGGVAFLNAAVFLSGGAVVMAVERVRVELRKQAAPTLK